MIDASELKAGDIIYAVVERGAERGAHRRRDDIAIFVGVAWEHVDDHATEEEALASCRQVALERGNRQIGIQKYKVTAASRDSFNADKIGGVAIVADPQPTGAKQ